MVQRILNSVTPPKQKYKFEDVVKVLTADVQVGRLLITVRPDERLMEVYILKAHSYVTGRIPNNSVCVYSSATPERWLCGGPWVASFGYLIKALQKQELAVAVENLRLACIDEILCGGDNNVKGAG